MGREITVKGYARVTAPSDITGVRVTVRGKEYDYKLAVQSMTAMTVRIKDAIEDAGIPRNDLKTSNVSVKQAYRKKKVGEDKYGDPRYEDAPDGFEYVQDLSFEFKNDNEKLSKSVANIMACDVTPRIEFFFKSSDREGMKNRALADACKNAKNEAEIIVQSVGAHLGRLITVKRNVREREYEPYDDLCLMEATIGCARDMTLDVDPEDSSVSEEVTMVWEIVD